MSSKSGSCPRTRRSCPSLLLLLKGFPTTVFGKLRPPREAQSNTVSSDTLEFIAAGKSGVVYGINNEQVLKEFHESEGGEIERRVYQRLGSHPHIVKLLHTRTDGSIILERGNTLRTICRNANNISLQEKIRWLREAAEGYQYLHACNIFHGDVGSNNLVIAKDGRVKLIDFEGCSIDGGSAGSCYEWFSYRPSVPRVTEGTDIFAFGCLIYEVLAGRPPHHEFETLDDPYKHVEELYKRDQFPNVTDLALGQVIYDCWHWGVNSMGEVIEQLEASTKYTLRK
ncbi:kinase-like domain-containing protein [Phaeosphaeriaceae sp. PMI808]|nr:kinase-like domain-containing protein [Phaeosphaeriaceae sp. PMI808]